MKKPQTAMCCRRFTLPCSPEDLKKNYQLCKDIDTVVDMVIYLGYKAENVLGEPTDYYQHLYSCKHLNKRKGTCKIYEKRPAMCSGFPYNAECGLKQCGTYKFCNGTKKERSFLYKLNKNKYIKSLKRFYYRYISREMKAKYAEVKHED
jgi:Fe-S-cluster containining protein